MKETKPTMDTKKCLEKGPQSTLERSLIEEFLLKKGYRLEDLRELPQEEAKQLMKEACSFASLKLAEMEAKKQFREEIRFK